MVRYQLGYGGGVKVEGSAGGEEKGVGKDNKQGEKGVKSVAQWFELEDQVNNCVYVSGLPKDVDEAGFVEFMGKCGLVMKDIVTGEWKVKLYRDKDGGVKGDGVCTYIKVDSVELALKILDGSWFNGSVVKVERAKFQMKGEYDPGRKPKAKKKKEKVKIKKMHEKLFSWKPEKMKGERGKNERVVVVKHAFSPEEFEVDVGGILEVKEDFAGEAGKIGTCRRVDVFDNNTDGALKIHMTTPEEADGVVANFNGRFFGGRRLEAYIWDGHEKLNVVETEAERTARMERWSKYVDEEDGEDAGGASKRVKIEGEVTPPRVGAGDVESDDEDKFYDE